MRKIVTTVISILTILILSSCGASKEVKADYNTKDAETALNNGEDLTGKTVEITVDKLAPNSAFGYNIQTGEHLNFVSNSNPKVKTGETLVVKIDEVNSVVGSFIINYTTLSSNKKTDKTTITAETLVEKEPLDFESYSTNINFDEFVRNPNENIGKKKISVTKIIQVVSSDDDLILLGTVRPAPNVTRTVMFMIPKENITENILEQDEIRVWMRLAKETSYTATTGAEKHVPLFIVDFYELIPKK